MTELFKVCIAQADSGVESENFWKAHHYYDENQWSWPGITKFGQALINHTIQKTPKAKWAVENAAVDKITKHNRHWVRRLEDTEEWIIYDIFVNLNEHNFLIWKLKQ